MTRILFVCTGNTCRSPMAESLLRHMASDRGIAVEARSAGVAAMDGMPMSRHAQTVLHERNMTNASFSSRSLEKGSIDWADIILTLTSSHKQHLIQQFEGAADKVFTLKEYVEEHDASHQNEQIHQELHSLMAELQLKLSMGEQPSELEIARVYQLQARMPSLDIQDPYGGHLDQYRETAEEIRTALELVLDKLEQK
ncbi:low molecular weight protein arginine phosphatase [Paenibacillus sp. SC116]|uniref:low molecular weight protein arginine phosphatase n=1 Tax=Paenibacillus sp. SC116 TaxID=2968986 RepID=UPI00215A6C26|nr:low molecular weight protein arginine phosphatase [Paenibacillus sp. SC116]MCR8844737.1 low molecular weight protein arginine phosphatase [Paenibacillus sp. SC116]